MCNLLDRKLPADQDKLKRRRSLASWLTAGLVVLALILFLTLNGLNAFVETLSVQHYQVESKKTDTTLRLALLTDLHSNFYGDEQHDLLTALIAAEPDMILIAGDLFDSKIPADGAEALLDGLPAGVPVFYATGNNEYKSGQMPALKQIVREAGVEVLEGECQEFGIKGTGISVCGLDDSAVKRNEMERQSQILAQQFNPDLFTILLYHRPNDRWLSALLPLEFDLILNGHLHGGQWRIPGWINGVIGPDQLLFPKYAGGKYQRGNSVQIVSRGLAKDTTWIPRIFNRPELVVVDILPKK